MANVTTVEKFPKSNFEQSDVEKERDERRKIPGVLSSEITSDDGNWVLTTTFPGDQGDAPPAAGLAAAAAAALDQGLTKALKTALRLHEIGDASPYVLSFAGKAKSGASFGFMQGDLAAGQPSVRDAFRAALTAAGVPDAQITDIMRRLSVHLISNPLTATETALVNAALASPAGRSVVDAMDDTIFQQVNRHVQDCLNAAAASRRQVAPKAEIYMALWINMSGPPTTLLHWLSGASVTLTTTLPPPPMTVDAAAMETYLHATSYFSENPHNFAHMTQSAAAGMNAVAVA